MKFYLTSDFNSIPLKLYRVKHEFHVLELEEQPGMPNYRIVGKITWPVGAIRLWTDLESIQFATAYRDKHNLTCSADEWFKAHFDEVYQSET